MALPARTAQVDLKWDAVTLSPPATTQTRNLQPVEIYALSVVEHNPPEGAKALRWVLLTTVAIGSRKEALRCLRWYTLRWRIGVSRQGHINQSVKVRPRLEDSSLVAREASWSKSETMKPSDNMLRKEYAQLTRLQRTVNADVASLHVKSGG
jgi:hypothetical protein